MELVGMCSSPEYYLQLPNGDEIYSVTAVYVTSHAIGSMDMDETESIDRRYFKLDDLPDGLNEANRHYIETYNRRK
ncbi:hypothetical protein [Rossellomorea sp. NPDC077527]|uniref:hypothetical protein n=1 Tax=Rossellomorea sp. NPDC077527 TaxID=3364510 RepID=UPI0037CC285A